MTLRLDDYPEVYERKIFPFAHIKSKIYQDQYMTRLPEDAASCLKADSPIVKRSLSCTGLLLEERGSPLVASKKDKSSIPLELRETINSHTYSPLNGFGHYLVENNLNPLLSHFRTPEWSITSTSYGRHYRHPKQTYLVSVDHKPLLSHLEDRKDVSRVNVDKLRSSVKVIRANPKKLLDLSKFQVKRFGRDVLVYANERQLENVALKVLVDKYCTEKKAFWEILARRAKQSMGYLSPHVVALVVKSLEKGVCIGETSEVLMRENFREISTALKYRLDKFDGVSLVLLTDVFRKFLQSRDFSKFFCLAANRFHHVLYQLRAEEVLVLLEISGVWKFLVENESCPQVVVDKLIDKIFRKLSISMTNFQVDDVEKISSCLVTLGIRDLELIKGIIGRANSFKSLDQNISVIRQNLEKLYVDVNQYIY